MNESSGMSPLSHIYNEARLSLSCQSNPFIYQEHTTDLINSLQWKLEDLSSLSSSLEVYWPCRTSPRVYRHQGTQLKGGQHPWLPLHQLRLLFGDTWGFQNSSQEDTRIMLRKSSLARLFCGNHSVWSDLSRLPHQVQLPPRLHRCKITPVGKVATQRLPAARRGQDARFTFAYYKENRL